jgi:predicted DNA binding CopG/RHH family protein
VKKALQMHTKEYLERSKQLSVMQILEFLDNYQKLVGMDSSNNAKCKLISLKIEPTLLAAFKRKAELEGVPYQTQIKKIMRDWVIN